MSARWWKDKSRLETRLRASRPDAPEELVRSLSARARSRRGPRLTPRLAFAGLASAVMLVGLAAVGGIGRAASEVVHVVRVTTDQTDVFGHRMAIHVVSFSAANDQYERNGTRIRGHRYTGTPVKSLHLSILRPGTIKTDLRVPAGMLKAGETYKVRVTAVDFDGHKTVGYVSFTA